MKVIWLILKNVISILFFWAILYFSYNPEFEIIVSLIFMIMANQWEHQALNRIQFSSLSVNLGKLLLKLDSESENLKSELDKFSREEEKGMLYMIIPSIANVIIWIIAVFTILSHIL